MANDVEGGHPPPQAPPSPGPTPVSPMAQALKRRRRIHLLIEITQAIIAVGVTSVTLYVSGKLALMPESAAGQAASLLLSNAFFLVIGYYFGRTNPRPGQRTTDVEGTTIP